MKSTVMGGKDNNIIWSALNKTACSKDQPSVPPCIGDPEGAEEYLLRKSFILACSLVWNTKLVPIRRVKRCCCYALSIITI